jgi:hypothetical protein
LGRLTLTACAVAALVVAGSAAATIVPQRGIGGVTLGMTKAKVRSIRGAPVKVRIARNDFGPYTVYRYRGLVVTFQGNAKVTSLETSSRRERTRSGVGVGSTESQVRAGVPRVRCRTESGVRHCSRGAFLPGRRVTDFFFKRGVVSRVNVGFVID